MSYNLRNSTKHITENASSSESNGVRRSKRIAAKKEAIEKEANKDRIITEVLTNLHGMKYRY